MEKQNKNLGYLGVDFQFRLVKALMEDKDLFRDLHSIIDQNTFTDPNLRLYVGLLKDYYDKQDSFPSYEMMGIVLNEKAKSDIDRETFQNINEKIRATNGDGVQFIKEEAIKFYRQQNIVKTANEILKIAGDGDTSKYEKCVDLLTEALAKGASYDLGQGIFDELNDTLAPDYREPIPTGLSKLDEALNGGLGKGELGMIAGSSGFGKALPLSELVLTNKGYIPMGKVKVGTRVIGRDGKSHKVIGVYPQGKRDIYQVTFSDGTVCRCDLEHLWAVNTAYMRGKKNDHTSLEVITLKEIIERGLSSGNVPNFKVPFVKPVEFTTKKLNIDPYDYGCQLATKNKQFKKQFTTKPLIIDKKYIFNSLPNRIKLLNGIMDKMGSSMLSGYSTIVTPYKTFADDFKMLINSLGGKCKEQFLEDKFAYKISFILTDENIKIFTKENKQKLVKYKEYESFGKYIIAVQFEKQEEAQCIMVKAKDHLFVTNNFTVTHNTTVTTAMASYAATFQCANNLNQGYKVLQIVFEDGVKAIKRKHLARLTEIEACQLSTEENLENVKSMISHDPRYNMLQNNLRILSLPTGEITANKIKEYIKKLINIGFRPDLVIVDYFECIDLGVDKADSEWSKEGRTMRKFENMAKELNIALWIPTQGSKDSSAAEVLTVDKIGGSAKKVQISHVIVTIARTVEDIKNKKATISLMKNRAGIAGLVWTNVDFDNGTCIISMDNVDDGQDMFEYKKQKEKEEMDLQTAIFKTINAQKQ